jgi:hypothetical protein
LQSNHGSCRVNHLACVMTVLTFLLCAVPCFAQFRVAHWNVARLFGDTNAIQDVFEALAADDKPGFATAPHLYIFQEVRNDNMAVLESLIAAAHPTLNYTRATFTTSGVEDGSGGAQALFYRSDRVTEDTFGHRDIFTEAGRRTDRWKLQLIGYQFDLYVYSSHLKAGQGDTALRESGAESIREDSDSLPAGTHVIYVGDYNFYTNSEPGYQVLVAPGNAQAVDPLGTGNWTGSSNAWKHTQSPRSVTSDNLVGGAMDDRFDQHLTTAGLQDGDGLAMLSYRAFGNDGNHWNESINDGNNTYYSGDIARSNALADDLYDASDHIPVVVDYQFPGMVSTFVQDDQGTVIEDALVNVDVLVANGAPGAAVDSCPVYVEGSSGIYGDDTIFNAARLPDFNTVTLTLDTTEVGDILGVVRIEGLGQDVGNALYEISTSALVIAHAQPSFSALALQPALEVEVLCPLSEGVKQSAVDLHNFEHSPNQARMQYQSLSGLPAGVSLTGTPGGLIGSTPDQLEFEIDPDILGVGAYLFELTVELIDEDLPGAISHQIDLDLRVIVEDGEGIPGDLNNDGFVDGADLAMLLGAWNTAKYDLDGDGIVTGSDLAVILGNWFSG